MLLKAQRDTGSKECKLVKSVATRFGSVLASFRSCLENRKALTHLYTNLVEPALQQRVPSEMTWEVVATVYLTMKPIMASLMSSQSSSSHCMLSTLLHKIIQLYIRLVQQDEDEADVYIQSLEDSINSSDFQALKDLHEKLRDSVCGSLREILQPFSVYSPENSLYWLVLMIDPRFKLLDDLKDLQDADGSFDIDSLVIDYEDRMLYPTLKKSHLALNPSALDSEDGRMQTRSRSRRHRRDFLHHQRENRAEDRIKNIIKSEYFLFRDQDELEDDACPFLFYRTFAKRFPTLAYLVKTLFGVPSSQTSVERLFSVAGHVANARRNRMKIETLDMMMGININLPDTVKSFDVDAYLDNEAELIEEYEQELNFDSE